MLMLIYVLYCFTMFYVYRFIFNLILPFLEVCILVRKETLRLDKDEPINHHGQVLLWKDKAGEEFIYQAVLPSNIGRVQKDGADYLGIEDLDETEVSTISGNELENENNEAIIQNLTNVDGQAQVKTTDL